MKKSLILALLATLPLNRLYAQCNLSYTRFDHGRFAQIKTPEREVINAYVLFNEEYKGLYLDLEVFSVNDQLGGFAAASLKFEGNIENVFVDHQVTKIPIPNGLKLKFEQMVMSEETIKNLKERRLEYVSILNTKASLHPEFAGDFKDQFSCLLEKYNSIDVPPIK